LVAGVPPANGVEAGAATADECPWPTSTWTCWEPPEVVPAPRASPPEPPEPLVRTIDSPSPPPPPLPPPPPVDGDGSIPSQPARCGSFAWKAVLCSTSLWSVHDSLIAMDTSLSASPFCVWLMACTVDARFTELASDQATFHWVRLGFVARLPAGTITSLTLTTSPCEATETERPSWMFQRTLYASSSWVVAVPAFWNCCVHWVADPQLPEKAALSTSLCWSTGPTNALFAEGAHAELALPLSAAEETASATALWSLPTHSSEVIDWEVVGEEVWRWTVTCVESKWSKA